VQTARDAHRRIFQALESGDAQTVEQWMDKHFVDFRRGCELAGLDLDDAVTAPTPSDPERTTND